MTEQAKPAESKAPSLNFFGLFELFIEAGNMMKIMQADGTLTRLHDAINAIEREVADPRVQAFLSKIRGFIK